MDAGRVECVGVDEPEAAAPRDVSGHPRSPRQHDPDVERVHHEVDGGLVRVEPAHAVEVDRQVGVAIRGPLDDHGEVDVAQQHARGEPRRPTHRPPAAIGDEDARQHGPRRLSRHRDPTGRPRWW